MPEVQAARLVERSIVAIETGDLTMEDEDWHGDTMASLRAAIAAERATVEAAAAKAGTLFPTACSPNISVFKHRSWWQPVYCTNTQRYYGSAYSSISSNDRTRVMHLVWQTSSALSP